MNKKIIQTALACLVLAGSISMARAAEYFVDGSRTAPGDGSRSAPFNSLGAAFSANRISGGDKITVLAGDYGTVLINGARFARFVDIVAEPGARVLLDSLTVKNSNKLRFSGFKVWPKNPEPSEGSLVKTTANSKEIVFEDFDIRSDESALGYRKWPLSKWLAVKRRGVLLRGPQNTIRNSQITGLYIAISATGEKALISGNQISGFSGDGMRALGDYSLVTGNFVQDCIKINKNHDDGFQSWSRGPNGKTGLGTVRGLTVENNIILEWNGPTTNPLRCTLQGIGLYDGMFEGLTIQNNVVAVRAVHGISIGGAINSVVLNNTIVNADGSSPKQPRISVTAHKRGTPPRNVVVANNVTMALRLPPKLAQLASNNRIIASPMRILNNPLGNDFRPRANSGLINAGNDRLAPATDILGTPRPQRGRSDIGAFEMR